jgi:chemotaxis protein MotB
MRKKKRPAEYDNPDRWVVSYADFITLLFAFFTVMYAISHVDSGKLDRFSGSMKSALKSSGTATSNNPIIEGIKPINYEDARLEKEMRSALEKSGIMDQAVLSRDERGVLLSLGDTVLFDPGFAEVKAEARPLLTAVAGIIRQTQNRISIEGHTDNTPIRNSRYPTNWELSTARATSVLMSLLHDHHVNPERFSASGYGEYRPASSNASPEGRAKNRRVDIIFVSKTGGT